MNNLKSYLIDNNQIDVIKCLALLKNNDTNYDYTVKDYEKGFSQPSYDLSLKMKFNIYNKWELPFNWSHKDLQLLLTATYYIDNSSVILDELFEIFIKLNPILNKVNLNVPIQNDIVTKKYHILFGIASMFNLHDISEYCDGGYGYVKRSDHLYLKDLNKLEAKYGHCGYVVSYHTMNRIKNKKII